MEDLKSLREKINKIDDEMARLFVERMEVSEQIFQVKQANGLPIFDAQRETENLLNSEFRVSPEMRPYYTEFLIKCMELSKKLQTKLKEQAEATDEK